MSAEASMTPYLTVVNIYFTVLPLEAGQAVTLVPVHDVPKLTFSCCKLGVRKTSQPLYTPNQEKKIVLETVLKYTYHGKIKIGITKFRKRTKSNVYFPFETNRSLIKKN